MFDQVLRDIDVDTQGNIAKRSAHPHDPIKQQRLPQG